MIPQVEDNNAAEQCPVICHASAVQHLDKAVPRIETDLELAVDGPFFCDPDKTNRLQRFRLWTLHAYCRIHHTQSPTNADVYGTYAIRLCIFPLPIP